MTDNVRLIPQDKVAGSRDELVRLFSACDMYDIRGFTADELVQWAEDGQVMLFLADGGKRAWALGLMDTAHGRIAELMGVVGEGFIECLAEYWAVVEHVCRQANIDRVILNGRPGWQRVMDKQGFVLREVAMVKEL